MNGIIFQQADFRIGILTWPIFPVTSVCTIFCLVKFQREALFFLKWARSADFFMFLPEIWDEIIYEMGQNSCNTYVTGWFFVKTAKNK